MSVTQKTKSQKSLRQVIGIISASIPLLTLTFGGVAMAARTPNPTGNIYNVSLSTYFKGEFYTSSQTCFAFNNGSPGAPAGTPEYLPVLQALPFGSANYAITSNQGDWQAVIPSDAFGMLVINGMVSNQNGVRNSTISGKILDLTHSDRYYTFSGNKVASCSVRPQHW